MSAGDAVIRPLGILLAVLLLATGCTVNASPPEETAAEGARSNARISKGTGPHIGYTAPDFQLTEVRGGDVQLSDYRGKVVLLNFWATWCGPCRIEMPALQALREDYGPRSFEVVSVAGDFQGARVVRPFVDELKLTFPALLDADGNIQDMYYVNALPMSFVLDRNGVIVYKLVGFFDWNSKKYRGLIEKVLNEA